MYRSILILLKLLFVANLSAQYTQTDIKVYNFNDGLSHRNVFDVLQDGSGFLWLATIDGLNRFDGYNFTSFEKQAAFADIEMISKLELFADSLLYGTSPDFITETNVITGTHRRYQIKQGELKRRESLVPTSIVATPKGLYLVIQEEISGHLKLCHYRPGKDDFPQLLGKLDGQYPQRPLLRVNDKVYCAAHEQQLWEIDVASGQITRQALSHPNLVKGSRIVGLTATATHLWALMNDGQLYARALGAKAFDLMNTVPVKPNQNLQTLHVSEKGDIYVGGFGQLWLFDAWRSQWEDLDAPIRQLVKNTCTYRDILLDASGTIWVASDFGAVRITRSDRLFTQYLSGGSEYCSNVYCSTRGITEDDNGLIYISYYNSIHVLDPASNDVRPLFPANDYFNYPYGLIYAKGHLYAGDGTRIRLSDLSMQNLFTDDGESEGAVAVSPDSLIWFGYDRQLLIHDPVTEKTRLYRNRLGQSWAEISGAPISYLLPGPNELFIGTTDAGVYQLNLSNDRIRHWQVDSTDTGLRSNRINAIYLGGGNDQSGDFKVAKDQQKSRVTTLPPRNAYIATSEGLHRIDLQTGEVKVYNETNGLPNNFINGMLPEGDTAIWASTDFGLCRFSLQTENCLNFFTADGLSSDEFNRISFYRSKAGRLYFGGLNGVNAFVPERRFLEHRRNRAEVPLLMTNISYVDGSTDSLYTIDFGSIAPLSRLELDHDDRLFNFTFSLTDYRHPGLNRYSYFLEGYDQGWSPESSDYRLRFTDIPPGEYTLHVRARVAKEEWLNRQISLPIIIKQPYYYRWWFWASVAGLVVLAGFGLLQFRIYAAQKQQAELEKTVRSRTAELAAEKQKSEDLLLNILPAETARELKEFGKARARRYEQVTVFFSDFVSFTAVANTLEPEQLVEELDFCFRTFDQIVARYGLEKIKTIGDAYLFIGTLDADPRETALNCVRASRDIQVFLRSHAEQARQNNGPVFRARIGLHTGPLVTGVVGTHKFAYDIWGETVNVAARMESNGIPEGIVVSAATYQLIGSEFHCTPFGTFEEHGKEVEMWLVG